MTAGVVTGEAVALDVRLAHWPSRLVAFVIDVVVQYMCWLVITLVLTRALSDADSDLAAAVAVGALVVVVLGYPISLETLWRGRTLGKAALGIRVVRDDGGPERFRHAAARAVLMPLEFWGPALLSSIINRRAKRLGDLLAGTVVVQARVPGRIAPPVAMPPPLASWASTLDLSRMPDELALVCRQFVARQHDLKPGPRDAMGSRLVAAVQATVSPPPPAGTPGWAYLSAVLAERRRREEWRLQVAAQRSANGTPTYGTPAYGTPAHGAPPYGTPSYGAPRYGTPADGTPERSQPDSAKPAPPPGPFTPPA
jgi:uncharacterized RDD family membrane protein YckC